MKCVMWAKVWHATEVVNMRRTYCGIKIPTDKLVYVESYTKKSSLPVSIRCGRCFD